MCIGHYPEADLSNALSVVHPSRHGFSTRKLSRLHSVPSQQRGCTSDYAYFKSAVVFMIPRSLRLTQQSDGPVLYQYVDEKECGDNTFFSMELMFTGSILLSLMI
jgi:hypothetical protein